LASSTNFNGSLTCYANDLSRNLETARVEGLTGSNCSTFTAANAVLPSSVRKTSTHWHPDWRMPVQIAEPGRITTYVYNGQPDPFNGSAIASCAPQAAALPDGKPISALCKQVEQATTDLDGHLGFGAAVQNTVPSRIWTYAYNQYGQVLTAIDPRGNTTTYAYYSDTTAAHTRGDLQQVTDAAGLVTQYPKYNPHGQVLQTLDPNGVATDYTYDLRQRLTSMSVAGQTTTYEYWPTGLLKKVTQPDGGWVAYGYDDAHRLTDVSDNLGNSVHYTLDNSGNRTKEETKDPSGALALQLSRVMDALSRVQQTTGRE
jgi:YD repeat-containing protein